MKFNPKRSEENLRQRLKYSLKQLDSGKWTWKHDPKFQQLELNQEAETLWELIKDVTCSSLVIRGNIPSYLCNKIVGSDSKVTTKKEIERMMQLLPNGIR